MPLVEEGVVTVGFRVEISAQVRPFVSAYYPTKDAIAFDQRFEFTFPGADASPAANAAPPVLAENGEHPIQSVKITTPPTGVWEAVPDPRSTAVNAAAAAAVAPAAASDGSTTPAPTAPAFPPPDVNHRRWVRPFTVRMDRATALRWEDLSLRCSVLERSLAIPAPPPMFKPDGSVMNGEEMERAKAEALAAAIAAEQAAGGGKSKRKGSAGASASSAAGATGSASARALEKEREKEAKAREKEKEKEKQRRRKEKEKAAKLAGLPPPPPDEEEFDRPSLAHPELENQDRPWVAVQECAVHLSPVLFEPFAVERTISQSVEAALCPPGGLVSYTVRVVADRDPLDAAVRRELNPLLITLQRVSHLPRDPLPTFEGMRATYKPVRARFEFFASGNQERVPPVLPPPLQETQEKLSRAEREAREAAHAAAVTAAVLAPPVFRAAPAPVVQSLPMPHASTLRFDTQRVVYLGLYNMAGFAAACQTRKLRVELRDREHRSSRTAEEVAAEAAAAALVIETARLAAEAAEAAKNKKGRKKSATPSHPSSAAGAGAVGDSARKSARPPKGDAGASVAAESPTPKPDEVGSDDEDSNQQLQAESALAHLSFTATSVDALLADAVAAAAAHSKLPAHLGGTRHLIRPPAQFDAAANVYGVAEFDLTDLFRGATAWDAEAAVKPVYPPSHLALIAPQRKVNPYQPSATRAQGPGGHETTVRMSFRLSHAWKGPLAHELPSRFERLVLWFPRDDSILYQKVLAAIARANVKAMGIVLPGAAKEAARWGGEGSKPSEAQQEAATDAQSNTSVALLALASVRLTAAQSADASPLDILTSVQVLDDVQRLFIIEGLSAAAGGEAFAALRRALGRERENEAPTPANVANPAPHAFFRMLSNPTVTFSSRLYGAFHLVPKNIRLKAGTTLQSLATARNSFYIVPKGSSAETFAAFRSLLELTRTPKLSVAARAGLFPSPLELASFEKYFGDFISDSDLFGGVPGLKEIDRYDPRTKESRKRMPDAAAFEEIQERDPARPRSRGQARSKAEGRSFDRDLQQIRATKRAGEKARKAELAAATAMFDALSREIDEQNRLASSYGGTAAALKVTPQLDLSRTLPRSGGGLDSSATSRSDLHGSSTRRLGLGSGEDAEVAEEVYKGFRRDKANAKAGLTMDNAAYLAARKEAQERAASMQFIRANISDVHAASAALAATKSPSDYPRYLQPEQLGLKEFSVYGNQKLNVYGLQMDLMRQQMQEAERASGLHKHYTYSEEYLSASFEKFSMDDAAREARAKDLAARITPDGFRWPAHKTHAESMHPSRDLHEATVAALQLPPDAGTTNLARLLDSKAAVSTASALHPQAFAAFPAPNREFGDPGNPEWGKSLGISCDAAEAIRLEGVARAKAEWAAKVKVKDTSFHVLWSGSGQVGSTNAQPGMTLAKQERERAASPTKATGGAGGSTLPLLSTVLRASTEPLNLLKDPPVRPGLLFNRVRVDSATGAVLEKRSFPVPTIPVSMHALSPFVDHNRTVHMRTLEQKEAAELEDTPRSPRPRFQVSAPVSVHNFIHKRKAGAGNNLPPTAHQPAAAIAAAAAPTEAASS